MKFINTTGVFCARTEMYSISKISFLDNRQKIDLFNKFAMGGLDSISRLYLFAYTKTIKEVTL